MNNIVKKNIIYSLSADVDMPAQSNNDISIKANQLVNSTTINSRFRRMLDNDLYIERDILDKSNYNQGVKEYSEGYIKTAEDNTKIWSQILSAELSTSLSAYHKQVKTPHNSLSSVLTIGYPVNFTNYNLEYMAGFDSGLYRSTDGANWKKAVVKINNGTNEGITFTGKFKSCYFDNTESPNILLFGTADGLYRLEDSSIASLGNLDDELLIRKIDSGIHSLSVFNNDYTQYGQTDYDMSIKSIYLDKDTDPYTIYLGTADGIFSGKWSSNTNISFVHENINTNTNDIIKTEDDGIYYGTMNGLFQQKDEYGFQNITSNVTVRNYGSTYTFTSGKTYKKLLDDLVLTEDGTLYQLYVRDGAVYDVLNTQNEKFTGITDFFIVSGFIFVLKSNDLYVDRKKDLTQTYNFQKLATISGIKKVTSIDDILLIQTTENIYYYDKSISDDLINDISLYNTLKSVFSSTEMTQIGTIKDICTGRYLIVLGTRKLVQICKSYKNAESLELKNFATSGSARYIQGTINSSTSINSHRFVCTTSGLWDVYDGTLTKYIDSENVKKIIKSQYDGYYYCLVASQIKVYDSSFNLISTLPATAITTIVDFIIDDNSVVIIGDENKISQFFYKDNVLLTDNYIGQTINNRTGIKFITYFNDQFIIFGGRWIAQLNKTAMREFVLAIQNNTTTATSIYSNDSCDVILNPSQAYKFTGTALTPFEFPQKNEAHLRSNPSFAITYEFNDETDVLLLYYSTLAQIPRKYVGYIHECTISDTGVTAESLSRDGTFFDNNNLYKVNDIAVWKPYRSDDYDGNVRNDSLRFVFACGSYNLVCLECGEESTELVSFDTMRNSGNSVLDNVTVMFAIEDMSGSDSVKSPGVILVQTTANSDGSGLADVDFNKSGKLYTISYDNYMNPIITQVTSSDSDFSGSYCYRAYGVYVEETPDTDATNPTGLARYILLAMNNHLKIMKVSTSIVSVGTEQQAKTIIQQLGEHATEGYSNLTKVGVIAWTSSTMYLHNSICYPMGSDITYVQYVLTREQSKEVPSLSSPIETNYYNYLGISSKFDGDSSTYALTNHEYRYLILPVIGTDVCAYEDGINDQEKVFIAHGGGIIFFVDLEKSLQSNSSVSTSSNFTTIDGVSNNKVFKLLPNKLTNYYVSTSLGVTRPFTSTTVDSPDTPPFYYYNLCTDASIWRLYRFNTSHILAIYNVGTNPVLGLFDASSVTPGTTLSFSGNMTGLLSISQLSGQITNIIELIDTIEIYTYSSTEKRNYKYILDRQNTNSNNQYVVTQVGGETDSSANKTVYGGIVETEVKALVDVPQSKNTTPGDTTDIIRLFVNNECMYCFDGRLVYPTTSYTIKYGSNEIQAESIVVYNERTLFACDGSFNLYYTYGDNALVYDEGTFGYIYFLAIENDQLYVFCKNDSQQLYYHICTITHEPSFDDELVMSISGSYLISYCEVSDIKKIIVRNNIIYALTENGIKRLIEFNNQIVFDNSGVSVSSAALTFSSDVRYAETVDSDIIVADSQDVYFIRKVNPVDLSLAYSTSATNLNDIINGIVVNSVTKDGNNVYISHQIGVLSCNIENIGNAVSYKPTSLYGNNIKNYFDDNFIVRDSDVREIIYVQHVDYNSREYPKCIVSFQSGASDELRKDDSKVFLKTQDSLKTIRVSGSDMDLDDIYIGTNTLSVYDFSVFVNSSEISELSVSDILNDNGITAYVNSEDTVIGNMIINHGMTPIKGITIIRNVTDGSCYGYYYITGSDFLNYSTGLGDTHVYQQLDNTSGRVVNKIACVDNDTYLLATDNSLKKYTLSENVIEDIDNTSGVCKFVFEDETEIDEFTSEPIVKYIFGDGNFVRYITKDEIYKAAVWICSTYSNQTVMNILRTNQYTYVIGSTTTGTSNSRLFATSYQYTLHDDFYQGTVDDIGLSVNANYNTMIAGHISKYHNPSSFVTQLNQNKMPVDCSEISSLNSNPSIVNVIDQYEFSNHMKYITAKTHHRGELSAFDQDDVEDISYIQHKYLYENYEDIYIHIPSTNTYYVQHVNGVPNCNHDDITIYQKNVDADLSRDINKNLTELSVYIDKEHFKIDRIIHYDITGCSLPLKIFKGDSGNYNEDEKFSSMIKPSMVSTLDYTEMNDKTVLKFICFGTDEQSIRVIAKLAVTYYVRYNFSDSSRSTLKNGKLLDLQKYRSDKIAYTIPCPYIKDGAICQGWMTASGVILNVGDPIVEDIQTDGQIIDVYPVYVDHLFKSDTDTLIQITTSTSTFTLNGSISNEDSHVIVDYDFIKDTMIKVAGDGTNDYTINSGTYVDDYNQIVVEW